jgi:hypothetical protein
VPSWKSVTEVPAAVTPSAASDADEESDAPGSPAGRRNREATVSGAQKGRKRRSPFEDDASSGRAFLKDNLTAELKKLGLSDDDVEDAKATYAHLRMRDGEPRLWCKLCDKYIDPNHLNSASHQSYADYERAAQEGDEYHLYYILGTHRIECIEPVYETHAILMDRGGWRDAYCKACDNFIDSGHVLACSALSRVMRVAPA